MKVRGDVVLMGENNKCKGPEVGKKLAHMRARKETTVAATRKEGKDGTK